MNEAANVRAISALTDLKNALGRFADGAHEALTAAEAETRRTLEWLRERRAHWQREVERARQALAEARAALERCLRSGYYDKEGRYYPSNCSAEQRDQAHAERHLRMCEEKLRNVQGWQSRVEQAVTEYQKQAARLRQLAGPHTEQAQAFLAQKVGELEQYRAATLAGTVGAIAAGIAAAFGQQSGPSQTSPKYKLAGEEQEQLANSLRQLENAQAGGAVAQAIHDRGTTVQFGPTEEGAIAQYDPATNSITLSDHLKGSSPNVLAAHMAHEGTHVQWERGSSIDQEYHAFRAQAEVWRELKAGETDDQCDWAVAIITSGETDAKRILRRLLGYQGLPEF